MFSQGSAPRVLPWPLSIVLPWLGQALHLSVMGLRVVLARALRLSELLVRLVSSQRSQQKTLARVCLSTRPSLRRSCRLHEGAGLRCKVKGAVMEEEIHIRSHDRRWSEMHETMMTNGGLAVGRHDFQSSRHGFHGLRLEEKVASPLLRPRLYTC